MLFLHDKNDMRRNCLTHIIIIRETLFRRAYRMFLTLAGEPFDRHNGRRWAMMMASLLTCIMAMAQREILFLDSDTRQPIAGVSVNTDEGETATSDKRGIATLSIPFDTVRFSHLKYSPEMLLKAEVPDTMLLIPTVHLLPEVSVVELAPEIKMQIKGWVAQAAAEGAAMAPSGIASFDFANMIDRRRRRDRKHLEKAKEVLEKWDKKPEEE